MFGNASLFSVISYIFYFFERNGKFDFWVLFFMVSRDKSNTPSGFTLKLRRHIRSRRLEDVRQLGYDRVYNLSGSFKFYAISFYCSLLLVSLIGYFLFFFTLFTSRLFSSNLDLVLMHTMLYWSCMHKEIFCSLTLILRFSHFFVLTGWHFLFISPTIYFTAHVSRRNYSIFMHFLSK